MRPLLVLLVAGCGPDVPLASWDPVDLQALETRLATPTAGRASFEAWALEEAGRVEAVLDAATVLADVVEQVGADPEVTMGERDTGRIEGTSAWIRVACPGEGDRPDPDFAHGFVQLESPLLAPDELDDLGVRGDVLLTTEACGAGDLLVSDGFLPAWYDAPAETLALSGRATLTRDEPFDLTVEAMLGATWRIVLPLGEPGTATLETERGVRAPVTVHVADGSLTCTTAPFRCW